ncbi:MAG: ComEA family DNA-binding protein, partial [Negativicutes bacterium]
PGALRENLPEPEAQNSPAAKQDGLIHINTADEKTLEGLPGIGPVMARRIVEHRKQNGPFEKLEDLRKVRGIGEAKFARLKDKAAL